MDHLSGNAKRDVVGINICKDRILIHPELRSKASFLFSGIPGVPAVRTLLLELSSRLHFRLIVGTSVTSGITSPRWLHSAPGTQPCHPQKSPPTLAHNLREERKMPKIKNKIIGEKAKGIKKRERERTKGKRKYHEEERKGKGSKERKSERKQREWTNPWMGCPSWRLSALILFPEIKPC